MKLWSNYKDFVGKKGFKFLTSVGGELYSNQIIIAKTNYLKLIYKNQTESLVKLKGMGTLGN